MKHDELTYGEALKILDNFGVICLPGDVHKNARNLIKHLKRQNELWDACKALLSKESEMTTGACYLEFRVIEAIISKADGGK